MPYNCPELSPPIEHTTTSPSDLDSARRIRNLSRSAAAQHIPCLARWKVFLVEHSPVPRGRTPRALASLDELVTVSRCLELAS